MGLQGSEVPWPGGHLVPHVGSAPRRDADAKPTRLGDGQILCSSLKNLCLTARLEIAAFRPWFPHALCVLSTSERMGLYSPSCAHSLLPSRIAGRPGQACCVAL